MSMNFSEFKKLIGADPWNREPETLRARNSAPEFEAAAEAAEAFEDPMRKGVAYFSGGDFESAAAVFGQRLVLWVFSVLPHHSCKLHTGSPSRKHRRHLRLEHGTGEDMRERLRRVEEYLSPRPRT